MIDGIIPIRRPDLPFVELTNIDRYAVTLLAERVLEFRDCAYFITDWINLNKRADQLRGARCQQGSRPFLDGLLTVSRATSRLPPEHLSRVLRV